MGQPWGTKRGGGGDSIFWAGISGHPGGRRRGKEYYKNSEGAGEEPPIKSAENLF